MESTDPYRDADDPPLRVYTIRSSAWFAIGCGVVATFAIATLWVGLDRFTLSGRTADLVASVVLTAIGPLALIAMWTARGTYLVAGGRASLRLYADRIEISDGAGDHFIAAAQMQVEEKRYRGRIVFGFIPFVTFETDRVIRLQSPGRDFQISRRVFEHPAAYEDFCNDVDRMVRGIQASTNASTSAAPAGDPEQHYRDRLAYELDHVDDV